MDVSMYPESDQTILVSANVSDSMFHLYAGLVETTAWLSQGSEWTGKKSWDVMNGMLDFLAQPNIKNSSDITEVGPLLADYLGSSLERVEYIYNFMSSYMGASYPDLLVQAKEIVPFAGHPTNNSGLFVGIYVFLTVLAAVMIGLRLYSRLVVTGYIKSYDYVLIFAAFLTLVFGALNSYTLSGPCHFRGRWDRSWEGYMADWWSSKFTEVMYPATIFFIKASLLLFYWTLTNWLPLRIGAVVLLIVSLGNSLALAAIGVSRCKPIVSGPGYEYFNMTCNWKLFADAEAICGPINIVTDVLIWLMPLPMVWKITQGMRERLLASLTFGVGALACIACGMRFSQFRELSNPSIVPRDQARWLIWALVEMYLAIICSCVPAIRALIIKKAPAIIGTTGDYTVDGKDEKTGESKDKSEVRVDSSSDV